MIKLVCESISEIPKLNNNFYKWFSDSKIIDDNGNPKIVYHGTNQKFNVFDISKIAYNSGNYGHYGYGFYFSEEIKEAQIYGSNIFACYLNITNPFRSTPKQLLELKRLGVSNIPDEIDLSIDWESLYNQLVKIDKVAAKLLKSIAKYGYEKGWEQIFDEIDQAKIDLNDIDDIFDYTTINKNVNGIADYVYEMLSNIGVDISKLKINKGFPYEHSLHWVTDLGNLSKWVTECIVELGYDGVIYAGEYIPFNASQIKSIDNDGTWDITDNDIYS